MSGPEHYRRAEALLAGRNNGGSNGARSCEEAIALAQVHATLALVAATADDRVRISHGDGTEYDVAVSGPAPSWAEVTA